MNIQLYSNFLQPQTKGDSMQKFREKHKRFFSKLKFPDWNPSFLIMALFFCLICISESFAQLKIPGSDQSDNLEAAGTLLKLIDTGLFKWGARVFAGVAILAAGHALMQQAFKIAVIAVAAAIIFGTCPIWVKNIFDIGGSDTLFSFIHK